MAAGITDLRAYARALASSTRLRVLSVLAEQKELGVLDLSRSIGLSQPLMSWHLRRLRRVGLVRVRRHGRQAFYSLDAARLEVLHEALSAYVEALSKSHAATVEEPQKTARL